VPPQAQLVDNHDNVYTLNAGDVLVNGSSDAGGSSVGLLVWDGAKVWAQSGTIWFYQTQANASWIVNGTTGPSCSGVAPTPTATGSATASASVAQTPTATATVTPTSTASANGATQAATPTATATAVQVSLTPFVAGVYRIGVNTGQSDNNFGPGAFTANMFDNPGFEPPSVGHLIIVASGATNSSFSDISDDCSDQNINWVGAKASVRTGTAAGDQFTISSYSCGGSYTFGSCQSPGGATISCPTLAQGTAVAEVITNTTVLGGMTGSGPSGSWWAQDSNCTYTAGQAFDGTSAMSCDVSDGRSHAVKYIWDNAIPVNPGTGGVCSNDNVTPCTGNNQAADCGAGNTCLLAPEAGPWHPVKGGFEIAFYAKALNTSTGTPQVSVSLVRIGGVNMSHTFTLTNDGNWHQYSYNFTGGDTGWTGGQNAQELDFSWTITNGSAEPGANIYIDDAYLGKQAASSTGLRSEFITTMQALNPGSIRLMGGGTMSANRIGLEGQAGCKPGQGAAPDTPGTCDFQHGAVSGTNIGQGQWIYSSADLYPLANQVSAVPWFSISNMFSDADLKTFIDNVCSALNTYPNIPAVYIEQSNEEWNSGSPSRSMRYGSGNLASYGAETGRNFSIMSAEASTQCPSLTNKLFYVIGDQLCNAAAVGTAMQGAANAGYPIPNTSQYGTDGAPYLGGGLADYSGDLVSQAEQYAGFMFGQVPTYFGPKGTGCINNGGAADWAFIGSNNFIALYENGPNNITVPGTVEQAYLSEGGYPSAGWMADNWLLAQQGRNETGVPFPGGRIPLDNEYQLAQNEYGGAPIWGFVHDFDADFGPAFPHLRPIGLGMSVVNSAIQQGGALFGVSGSTSGIIINPYNANTSGSGAWSAALVNTTASPVTLTLQFPASGTLPQTAEALLNTNGITDNTENSNDVYVGALPGGLSTSGQNVTFTLPPYSVVAIH